MRTIGCEGLPSSGGDEKTITQHLSGEADMTDPDIAEELIRWLERARSHSWSENEIAHGTVQRAVHEIVTLRKHPLHVLQLAKAGGKARADALEEAAQTCEAVRADNRARYGFRGPIAEDEWAGACERCAVEIRALKDD
jgi:hypothetical protein